MDYRTVCETHFSPRSGALSPRREERPTLRHGWVVTIVKCCDRIIWLCIRCSETLSSTELTVCVPLPRFRSRTTIPDSNRCPPGLVLSGSSIDPPPFSQLRDSVWSALRILVIRSTPPCSSVRDTTPSTIEYWPAPRSAKSHQDSARTGDSRRFLISSADSGRTTNCKFSRRVSTALFLLRSRLKFLISIII